MELTEKECPCRVAFPGVYDHLRDPPGGQKKAKLRFGHLWKALNGPHDTDEMGDLPEFALRIVFQDAPPFARENGGGYHDRDFPLSMDGLSSLNRPLGRRERD